MRRGIFSEAVGPTLKATDQHFWDCPMK